MQPEVAQFLNELMFKWHSNTGWGHHPAMRIQMSDRMYEVQANGEWRRVA